MAASIQLVLVYCLRNRPTGKPFRLSLSKPGVRTLRQALDRPFDRLRVNGIARELQREHKSMGTIGENHERGRERGGP